jgi:hypothetical protein
MAKKRKTLPKEIQELLQSGDMEALKEAFSRCEPNAVTGRYGSNIFSLTPLPREFALWAKEQGADVNFRDCYGTTPIFNHASFYNGDVPLLIELGADVRARKKNSGVTPLHLAATYGRTEAMRALIDAGAEVDVRATELFDNRCTPLEMALEQKRLPFPLMLEVCTILLDHGAQMTERARQSAAHIGEQFQRNKRGITDPAYLRTQEEGLAGLETLFGVERAPEVPFHDGVSPIVITETGFQAQFKKLWDYLIPPSGRAQTAQGEAIRIAGRVDDEITRNGGANWDGDYRSMLKVFPAYLRLGKPLSEADLAEAERIAALLRDGCDDETLSATLCAYAVAWVLQNPQVLPPLAADYRR